MQPNLNGLTVINSPSVAPGGRVAVVESVVDTDADEYRRRIWLVEGNQRRQFTSGDSDGSPVWSPDGSQLAFTREVDGKNQLAVMPANGGEAKLVTDFDLGVSGTPAWSPDGSRIAVVGVTWAEEWAELDDDERKRRPRRIIRRDYRGDQLGWTHDRLRSIYLVSPDGEADPRRLTESGSNEGGSVFSPDGNKVAFLSDVSEQKGYEPGDQIFEADLSSGTITSLDQWGSWFALGYRSDGVVHAIGYPGSGLPDQPQLWRFEPEAVCVTADHPRAFLGFAAGAPTLEFLGDDAVMSYIDSGAVGLVASSPEGKISTILDGRLFVTGFDVCGDVVAATYSTISDPGMLVVVDGDERGEVEGWGEAPPTIAPDHFTVDGPGGELDVWVYLPEGNQDVALLLNIHGGPAAQYGWGFFDEFQVYAAAGYGVVATNPRGSAGKDREFLQAVSGEGWGTVDVEDIDAVVEAALERYPRLDPDRLGVMGGSYGGFLTAWLIAHQSRWKSAIVERALLSWPSFGGTSDIGGWFGDRYIGDTDLEWERSPMRVADQTETPTLIIHSEHDFRCPIGQAEEYFNILARQGVETEFVRFPDEGHELSRSGSPKHRHERFEIILVWLDRTLR